jgi:SAM-dependent methyltransferase
MPPFELRELVGPTDPADFDNPTGQLVIGGVPAAGFSSVLDFGCGCGRLARQLLQQHTPPERYVGIDLHRGLIEWCQRNLAPYREGFSFLHHDVFNAGFNPEAPTDRTMLPFPVPPESVQLVIGWSVFTHLVEEQIVFYLREVCRVLRRDGHFVSTWFLFDKAGFPMMQAFQNCLYINPLDLTNAVIVDRDWLLQTCRDLGLVVVAAEAPALRGFQWVLRIRWVGEEPEIDLPPDLAPIGLMRPAMIRPGAPRLGASGLEDAAEKTGGASG